MMTYNSKLIEQVIIVNKQIQGLKEVPNAERTMIPMYREEAIINYKIFIKFMKSSEMSGCSFIVVQVLCYLSSFKDNVFRDGDYGRSIHRVSQNSKYFDGY